MARLMMPLREDKQSQQQAKPPKHFSDPEEAGTGQRTNAAKISDENCLRRILGMNTLVLAAVFIVVLMGVAVGIAVGVTSDSSSSTETTGLSASVSSEPTISPQKSYPAAPPTPEPAASSTQKPSSSPKPAPTASLTGLAMSPTLDPTASPQTTDPTTSPTPEPTASPTQTPSASPKSEPTLSPSAVTYHTTNPTAEPRRSRSIEIKSPTEMRNAPIPVTLVLPSSYDTDRNCTYPVLYLLHGAGDDHRAWVTKTSVASLADMFNILVVCPWAGTSWYFDSPIDPTSQFETFVSEELVGYIDEHYRTRPSTGSRAIMGNSMGGHGALFLGIRHPDVFGTAVSLSGGVDIRPFPNSWDIAKRIGTIEEASERWEELNVINQAKIHLKSDTPLSISIDCGTGDFFLNVNRALHEQLIDTKVPHNYTERSGGHSWGYWNQALVYQIGFVKEHIDEFSCTVG